MFSRKHMRWVIPAFVLIVIFFHYYGGTEYVSTKATTWAPSLQDWKTGGDKSIIAGTNPEFTDHTPSTHHESSPSQDELPFGSPSPSESKSESDSESPAVVGLPFGSPAAAAPPAPATSSSPSTDFAYDDAPTAGTDGLIKDVHKVKSADDFLPHFKAVTALPGLSVADTKKPCDWGSEEPVNFQYSADDEWNKADWPNDKLDKLRAEWHEYVNNGFIPYEQVKHKFKGRGIVFLAGNLETTTRVSVSLRIMSKMNYTVPVEIHHYNNEINETTKERLHEAYHDITFVDLAAPDNLFHTISNNFFGVHYNYKTAALIDTGFAEPLLMDSDNLPVSDPAELWESDTYKEFGTVFWPDIARTRPPNPMWAITNTKCRKDEYEMESGQLLVNKAKYWYHLQLAAWFNHNEPYIGYSFILGDKDMFRFAWHALKTDFGKPARWLTSVGVVFPDGKYCGHSFAQHHPDNHNIAFLHGGLLKTFAPSAVRWLTDRTRIFQSYKRSTWDMDREFIEPVGIYYHGMEFMETKPGHGVQCTDMKRVRSRDLQEIAHNFEVAFVEAGGYWIKEGDDSYH